MEGGGVPMSGLVGCWWAREARIEYIIYGSTITILATRKKAVKIYSYLSPSESFHLKLGPDVNIRGSHLINPIVNIQDCSCEDDYILVSIVFAFKGHAAMFRKPSHPTCATCANDTTYTDASVCGLT